MNINSLVFAAVSVCIIIPFNASAHQQNAGKHLILNLIGTGAMYEDTVPDIDGDGVDDPAICFDVNLVDANNNTVIGTATDCLSDVTPAGSGLALVGTTYFNLPGGTLITRGNTTVQPVLQETITSHGQIITHITGAASNGNAVIGGTGRFANATGNVRLSGMVGMTDFAGNVGDPIVFNCLFNINLE